MKAATKNENDRATYWTPDDERNDRGDGSSMSPSMRRLILSFGQADSERVWDPAAYTRRSAAADGEKAGARG